MKIEYKPSKEEVKKKRKAEYAKMGIEKQVEALIEYFSGEPEKLETWLPKYKQIKKDNPFSEVE